MGSLALISLLLILLSPSIVVLVLAQVGCQPCPPGCAADECAPGYCNTTDNCFMCSAGTFSLNASQNCLPCEAGTVSQPGSSNCTQCLAGTYAAVSEGICIGCPVGTWSSTGASNCQPCGTGKFSGKENATDIGYCQTCPAGYYCPQEANPAPILCPHNKYCPAQSVRPKACGFFYASDTGSVNCTLSNIVWLFVGFAGLIVLLGIGIILLRVGKRQRMESASQQREQEVTKLIPKPLPGPVYSGD